MDFNSDNAKIDGALHALAEQVQPLVLCEGAESREVHNVGILDCAPDKDGGYESYIPGEFIVTNLGFAHDDPELSERSLLVLIARGVRVLR